MSPYSTIARLRGIGVALINSICGSWLLRRRGILAGDQLAQRQALSNAEAMLFVDDTQAHARCMDILLNYRVGADDKLDFAALDARQQFLARFGRSSPP